MTRQVAVALRASHWLSAVLLASGSVAKLRILDAVRTWRAGLDPADDITLVAVDRDR